MDIPPRSTIDVLVRNGRIPLVVYEHFVGSISRRIQRAARNGETYILYWVPMTVSTIPTYNRIYVLAVLVHLLRRQRYLVVQDGPFTIRVVFGMASLSGLEMQRLVHDELGLG